MKTKNKPNRKYNKEKFIYKLQQLAEFSFLLSFSRSPSPYHEKYIYHALKNNFTMYELHLIKRFSEIRKYKNVLRVLNKNFF